MPERSVTWQQITPTASAVTMIVGAAVLTGWMLDISTLKSVLPGFVTMKANTALGFFLAGISLRLAARQSGPGRGIALACAALVALIGFLTFIQYLAGINLGIDQLLFQESSQAAFTYSPGRMAPSTAINFLLLGSALLLSASEHHSALRTAEAMAVVVLLIGILAVIGYVYGVPSLYGVGAYTQMAIHTSVTFLVLSLGVLFIHPERGIMALLTEQSASATTARILLPLILVLPPLLGWLSLLGQRVGLYHGKLGLSLLTMMLVVVMGAVVITTARSASKEEARRRHAEHELKAYVEALAAQTRALTEANKELEGFSYYVAHDLRAPLRLVSGLIRKIQDKHTAKLDEEARRLLTGILQHSQNMGRLIDDLLVFASLSRKQADYHSVDMAKLAKAVAEDLRALEPLRSIEIQIGELPTIEGDGTLLRQVWFNLLGNAIKYTRTRPVARIEVSAHAEGNEIVFRVQDNGVGFDMQYANKLFGAFQRLHGAAEFEGTGIGLALVQRIIGRHNGRVGAEANLDEGALFWFVLPRARAGENGTRGESPAPARS